jgi:hypothetical protein
MVLGARTAAQSRTLRVSHLSRKFQAREFPSEEPYTPVSKRFAPLTV